MGVIRESLKVTATSDASEAEVVGNLEAAAVSCCASGLTTGLGVPVDSDGERGTGEYGKLASVEADGLGLVLVHEALGSEVAVVLDQVIDIEEVDAELLFGVAEREVPVDRVTCSGSTSLEAGHGLEDLSCDVRSDVVVGAVGHGPLDVGLSLVSGLREDQLDADPVDAGLLVVPGEQLELLVRVAVGEVEVLGAIALVGRGALLAEEGNGSCGGVGLLLVLEDFDRRELHVHAGEGAALHEVSAGCCATSVGSSAGYVGAPSARHAVGHSFNM